MIEISKKNSNNSIIKIIITWKLNNINIYEEYRNKRKTDSKKKQIIFSG
jgi:hypothetical protein